MVNVAHSLERVREVIASAADRAGRDPDEVTLVAVTKGVGADLIREAVVAGQRDFGENRVQEALEKLRELGADPIRWHFVGRLQRNKIKHLVDFVSLIHSVDRVALAEEIGKRARRPIEVLIEVNCSSEPAKGGVAPQELPRLAEASAGIDGIRLVGLMTMAPVVTSADAARPYFQRLASLADDLRRRFPQLGIRHLSMGMSQDYAVAVEEGATMVRIGEAIFGPRSGPPMAKQSGPSGT